MKISKLVVRAAILFPWSALAVLFCGMSPEPPAVTGTGERRALDPAEMERLHRELCDSVAGERWDDATWYSDLWAARRAAAAQNKPLLIWAMNGAPQGST